MELTALIYLTNRCNLFCDHCDMSSGNPLPNELSTPEILALAAKLKEQEIENISLSGGEPVQHKDFFKIAQSFIDTGFKVSVITNATFSEAYYKKFLEEGLVEPDEVKKATAKYKVDNDKFNEFFDACVDEDSSVFESNKVVYNNFSSWWSSNYSTSKIPEIKELRRAMKIRYGNEKERVINGCVNYGFNVRMKEYASGGGVDDDEF